MSDLIGTLVGVTTKHIKEV